MPFGLSNAPRTFQRAMDELSNHLPYVKVYIDDILIHSEDEEKHCAHINEVLKLLHENGLSINFDKCEFFKNSVEFLGHILSPDGVKPVIDKVEPLRKIKPKNKRHIQKILGVINWFRGFIHNASKKTLFLTSKLRKEIPFSWSQNDQNELRSIIKEIEKEVILNYPNYEKSFTLETDASETVLGAVLLQESKPIGFYSYKLNHSELNYSIIEKETLAVLKALHHFRPIIFDSKVIIHTDNMNLIPDKKLTSRIQRWKMLLQEFDITVKQIEGNKNFIADTLSRLTVINENSLINVNWEKLRGLQTIDVDIKNKIESKKLFINDKGFVTLKKQRIYIPNDYRLEFIKEIHNQLLHPGIKKMYMTLNDYLNCKNLKKSEIKIINNCIPCQTTKCDSKIYGFSSGFLFSNKPFEFISSDIFGPLKSTHFKSDNENSYFFLITFTSIYIADSPKHTISKILLLNQYKIL
ncbi:Transposon Tf2-6 polyprotein [Dictyocoela muelleri]|nr:Transposon Tf2-6 polyprotein [Dictyocoela muelleri]